MVTIALKLCWHRVSVSQLVLFEDLQDFVVLKTIHDASDTVVSLAWNAHLLAVGGVDKKVWVYDSLKDWPGGHTKAKVALGTVFLKE